MVVFLMVVFQDNLLVIIRASPVVCSVYELAKLFLTSKFRVEWRLSSIINLSLITLANLSQFFSILSDLKSYRSTFSSFTNHL
jgi:hypothetical protein